MTPKEPVEELYDIDAEYSAFIRELLMEPLKPQGGTHVLVGPDKRKDERN